MEDATMSQEQVIDEIENEISKVKGESEEDLEIEVVSNKAAEEEQEQPEKEEPQKEEYGRKVEARIKKLVDQRRQFENQVKEYQEQNAQLSARLERLERGHTHRAENDFNNRYAQTKMALKKAVEEGDTDAQIQFQEDLAQMAAAMRVAQMQKQQVAQASISPTVGRAQQVARDPVPEKAKRWWSKNPWFNAPGFENETSLARAIDAQLDIEGHDKNSDEYYNELNNRLHKTFPELNSGGQQSKPRAKSRVVAPTAGGSGSYKGNRIRMTEDELSMARELGINNEPGLKRYVQEIKQSRKG